MAIASSSTPTFSASFCCGRNESTLLTRSPFAAFPRANRSFTESVSRCRLTVSWRLNSSRPSATGGSVSPDNEEGVEYEMQHGIGGWRMRRRGSPVFVKLPVDAVSATGLVRRRKAMEQSFRALVAAGVEGVAVEVWWGLVERERPRAYNWQGYAELVALARRCGLKVRVVMAFHQCGTGPGDPNWIPLPQWVVEEIEKDPDLAYSDRFGRRNMEYISLGCDTLPVLRGRSPVQVYADFMRNFRDTFRPLLGATITGIQVGMGPGGELRYPSCPSQRLSLAWQSRKLGEFQCYDKYMRASLNACAQEVGLREWGGAGPVGMGNLMHDSEHSEHFRSDDSLWNTPYGKFFLEWYSLMLLLHGERICKEAETIFRGIEVNKSAKVARIHWHYNTQSHPSELTAGYYNTSTRDGYIPIAQMLSRYGFALGCAGFEMQDSEEKQMNAVSSPEGFLRRVLLAARACEIPLEGENSAASMDDESFKQVLKMSKFYLGGLENLFFSFNFVRMDKNMFEYGNWVRFAQFVRQMSDSRQYFSSQTRLRRRIEHAFHLGLLYNGCTGFRVLLKSDFTCIMGNGRSKFV